ncbi:DUF3617 domain-containing protein [Aurantiacibacter rhizosphaerae]|uniref:DUF3617 family protein n=1 Tax=Aurantiacibacter rhizosphaerae TaxID=2691582 RepID=A0A844XFQ1_9SPHN|nr:DUF3617 family protein [Aurantiacibacter rhizosphaerae]MWV28569.1 DUF3617 family protein [Aurantiacibacter rhizosphaerae]
MRLIHCLPIFAGLALVACGGNSDEDLTDEALSMDDVLAEGQDNGIMPQPGEYRVGYDLISVDMESGQVRDMAALEAAFAEGAQEQTSFCITKAMDREAWISAMTDNSCTISRLTANGGDIDLSMTCEAEEGPQGRITMAGTTTNTTSDLQMDFTQPIPGVGDANIVMQVQAERTGACN